MNNTYSFLRESGPALTWLLATSVISVPEEYRPSFGLYGYESHVWCIYILVGKHTLTHTHMHSLHI